jgi:hypothetical protein
MTARLKRDGKPMRALRVLDRDGLPCSEHWVASCAAFYEDVADALGALVAIGLAVERPPAQLGVHRLWQITQAGRDYLASVDG